MGKKKRKKRSSNKKPLVFTISCVLLLFIIGTAYFLYQSNHKKENISEAVKVDANANTAENAPSSTDTTKDITGGSDQSSDNSSSTTTSTAATTEEENYTLETETPVITLKQGENCTPSITVSPTTTKKIIYKSNDSSVATVSSDGKITAQSDGTAIITCSLGEDSMSIYVNVVTNLSSKQRSTLTLYNQDGKKLTYRLYHQSAHDYSNYNSYLAWHGCATCSFTTVLNAFNETYKDYDPADVIDTIEKETASSSAWQEHHVKREMKQQMPPSLYGITLMLKHTNIPADYVRSFNKSEAKKDILAHLHTGNPVIFEVRMKSNVTGKSKQRWTASVHTMIFLGTYTLTGEVLVCDSVNRSWYSGAQRVKIVDIDDPMEYMFSCTTYDKTMYYSRQSSDGGYILIN